MFVNSKNKGVVSIRFRCVNRVGTSYIRHGVLILTRHVSHCHINVFPYKLSSQQGLLTEKLRKLIGKYLMTNTLGRDPDPSRDLHIYDRPRRWDVQCPRIRIWNLLLFSFFT